MHIIFTQGLVINSRSSRALYRIAIYQLAIYRIIHFSYATFQMIHFYLNFGYFGHYNFQIPMKVMDISSVFFNLKPDKMCR